MAEKLQAFASLLCAFAISRSAAEKQVTGRHWLLLTFGERAADFSENETGDESDTGKKIRALQSHRWAIRCRERYAVIAADEDLQRVLESLAARNFDPAYVLVEFVK